MAPNPEVKSTPYGVDPFLERARQIVQTAYQEGEFGPWARSPHWLEAKAVELAGVLQKHVTAWKREAL